MVRFGRSGLVGQVLYASKKGSVKKKVLNGTYSQESKKPWDSSDGILAMNVAFF